MFGWFKSKNKNKEITKRETENIVNDFGQVIGDLDWLSAFYDVKKLPHSKETTLNAIIGAYKLTADETMREVLKQGLLALTHFQENIGKSAVRGDVDLTQVNINELSPENFLAMNDGIDKEKYEQLSKQSDKEYNDYLKFL